MALSSEDIEKLLAKQTTTIQELFQETIKKEMKTLGDEIKSNLDNQLLKINDRIDHIEQRLNIQLDDVRKDVNKCIEQLNMNEENNKRLSLLNELKISGIAHSNGENLKEIFCSIALQIGVDTTNPLNVPDLARSYKKNTQNNDVIMLPKIIVRFVAKHIRNQFYGLYLAKIKQQPILTEHINLPQGGRVLIGEHLTMHNQLIFTEAIKLKMNKKLTRVNTIDDLVYVKANSTDKLTVIKYQRELDVYAAQSQQHSSTQSSHSKNITVNSNNNTTAAQAKQQVSTQSSQPNNTAANNNNNITELINTEKQNKQINNEQTIATKSPQITADEKSDQTNQTSPETMDTSETKS